MADLTITAANVQVLSGATVERGTAGEAITVGQVVYLKAADGKLWKADASAAASADAVGIAVTASTGVPPVDEIVYYVSEGPMDIGASVAIGDAYVVSATAGGVAPIADLGTGEYVTLLGISTSIEPDTLYVKRLTTGVAHA